MSALFALLADGGPVIAVLIVLSVLSIALIVVKTLQLRGVTSGKSRRAEAAVLWASGDRTAAKAQLSGGRTPADRMAQHAATGLLAGRARALLDGELEWRGNDELARLNSGIRLLDLIAMISPLLGLLGTVLGMIEAFRELALAQGAANAALLAGGIWQALLTTAAGLVVAIPAAVAAALLAARIDAAGQSIESAVGALYAAEDSRT